jgi:hypothetical protein
MSPFEHDGVDTSGVHVIKDGVERRQIAMKCRPAQRSTSGALSISVAD